VVLDFVGSHLVDALIAQGEKVFVIDNLSTGKMENLNPEAKLIKENVENLTLKEIKKLPKFDTIYHLAALARIQPSFESPLETYTANSTGTFLMCELAKHCKARLIYAGSSTAYHDLMANPYAYCKWMGENHCRLYNKLYNVPVAIARFFNCYDDETEILTESGFKFFKDLLIEDKIATLNPKTHNIEYHKAIAWQIFDYVGDLLHFSSKSYDLRVTPDHNMYIKKRNGDCQLIKANEILSAKTGYLFRLMCSGAKWIGEDQPLQNIQPHKDCIGRTWGKAKIVEMGDWCEFLGWFISEGSIFICGKNKEHRISISQYKSKNKENYERIVCLIKKMGFNPYLTKNGKEIIITSCQLYYELKKLFPQSKAENKIIPQCIKKLAPKYLSRIFNALMAGDGHKDGKRYTTKSPLLKDDFAELCLKLGKSVTTGYDSSCYKLSISTNNMPHLGNFYSKKINVKQENYKGKVYDVTVPNHIIYIRRNNRSCWSGNCYGPRQIETGMWSTVIGIFEKQWREGKPLTVTGNGSKRRDFTSVQDIVSGLLLMGQDNYNGEVFNLGTGKNHSILEVAKMFKSPIEFIPDRPGEALTTLADIQFTKKMLGWKPKFKLKDYIANVINKS